MKRKFDSRRLSAILGFLGVADDHLVHDNRGGRIDAALSVVFARQLEYVYSQFLETVYPALIARDAIPVDYSVPSGATAFTVRRLTEEGEADFVKNSATDYPMIDLGGEEVSQIVLQFGDGFAYSIQELRSAALAGVKLDAEKANAARRAIERKLDAIAINGVASANIQGLANATGVNVVTGLTGSWGTLTTKGQSIYDDIVAVRNAIITQSEGEYEPDTLVLSVDGYQAASTRRMNDYDSRTPIEMLESTGLIKNVYKSSKFKTAGAASAPRLAMYPYDKSVLKLVVPQEIESTEPQAKGRGFLVYNDMQTGGTQVTKPLAMAYADDYM